MINDNRLTFRTYPILNVVEFSIDCQSYREKHHKSIFN